MVLPDYCAEFAILAIVCHLPLRTAGAITIFPASATQIVSGHLHVVDGLSKILRYDGVSLLALDSLQRIMPLNNMTHEDHEGTVLLLLYHEHSA